MHMKILTNTSDNLKSLYSAAEVPTSAFPRLQGRVALLLCRSSLAFENHLLL